MEKCEIQDNLTTIANIPNHSTVLSMCQKECESEVKVIIDNYIHELTRITEK